MKRDQTLTWTMPPVLDFTGLKAVIVGGTGGIGRALALALVEKGASVTVVGRSFRDKGRRGLEFIAADLSLMAEARRVGETLPDDLDLVIFTTGIMAGPTRELTADGLERDLAVSYLSRLVVLRALAPRFARQLDRPMPRVFIMGFPGSGQKADIADLNSERSYGRMRAHMNTVAGNEALVIDAARRYPGLAVFGLNPGFVKTGIRGNLFGGRTWLYHLIETLTGLFIKSPEDYAQTLLPLFLAPGLDRHSGAMFDSKARAVLPSGWVETRDREALIGASEALVQQALPI